MLELGYHLGKCSFIKSDIGAEGLEQDLDGLNICAVSVFLSGDMDDRTLWSVFTLHQEWFSDFWNRTMHTLLKVERRRIDAAIR